MAILHAGSAAFFQAVTVLWCVLAVLVAHVAASARRHHNSRYVCPTFSCGELRNVSSPFRRPEDPNGCGDPSYELACSDTKATIRINAGTYYVVDIDYAANSFVVVDASLDMQSSCPLPRPDQVPYPDGQGTELHGGTILLQPTREVAWANFVNCSQAVRNSMYKQVDCLSTSYSYVYVHVEWYPLAVEDLEPSCGYLALIPFSGGVKWQRAPTADNVSYADVVRFMKDGFGVQFPEPIYPGPIRWQMIIDFLFESIGNFYSGGRTKYWIIDVLTSYYYASNALFYQYYQYDSPRNYQVATVVLCIVRWIPVLSLLCRFLLAPFSVLIFLAHKYWKARIPINAVEKFLRMQLMLGPTRYAYTDIIAITSHFRDKLGKGGYGSVYKGVVLPGNVHVAVKMLGNSNCNGEDFISEVSTIGRIHHVNVVRLVGFCSEEMRRALVYEYMPNGSLDKYIFSSEKSFSWDKLNEIALGIARGINYLHQGCDMQIVHFDIKPENILLGSNFVPKVDDFGLAKLCPRDNSFVPMSAMRGTIGYIAPEMISRCFGPISNKSDVYSFGMLLLEMAGGRRNVDPQAGSSSQAYYPSWVYSQLNQQGVSEISEDVDMHELEKKRCVVGLWCIQMRSHDRPTMSEVIEMLEAGIDQMEMPPRPFFCDDEPVPAVGSYYISSEMTAISEEEEEEEVEL
ncbi:hypothetical protein BS78_03G093500 [Paspalum vaginatum]|nr:hypothetical protein BS78_03G093500 [Paspalum vaginatum]